MSTSLQNKSFVALEIGFRELNTKISKELEIGFHELNAKISKELEVGFRELSLKISKEFEIGLRELNTKISNELGISNESDIGKILSEPKQSSKRRKTDKKLEETTTEMIQIAEQFKTVHSREEARTILGEGYSMDQLKSLAKYLEISVGNTRKKADLREKIIQETIGYRIDSMLIQEHKWDE